MAATALESGGSGKWRPLAAKVERRYEGGSKAVPRRYQGGAQAVQSGKAREERARER